MEERNGKTQKEDGGSRRDFIRQTLIGGLVVASGVGIGKAISSVAPGRTIRGAYINNDDMQQEKVMRDKEYVLMSREEKDRMVRMFEKEYKYTV